jgi:drug/metabolite transporter (DMT)-like permease
MAVDYYWLFALLAPAFFAVSNVIDNHVLHSRMRDPVSYNILTTWPTLPMALLILAARPVSLAFGAWFVGTAVGFVFAFLFVLYTTAMMREEGTNVVSVLYTSPLFVAVLASIFLGERLSGLNYAGIGLLVLSAFLILYRRIGSGNLVLGAMVVYALGSAVARVAAKSALENVDIWSYFFWFLIGGVIGTAILAMIWRRRLSATLRRLDAGTSTLVLATSCISTIGLVFLYTSFSLGSVAIASGLTAIQPMVVFLFTSVLVRFRPGAIPLERLTGRWAYARKVGAALLIVLGAFALAE